MIFFFANGNAAAMRDGPMALDGLMAACSPLRLNMLSRPNKKVALLTIEKLSRK